MKNGTTRLAYKPEHAVDLDTGVIVAAPIHPADLGDTNTLDPTLQAAAQNLAGIGLALTSEDRCDLVTPKQRLTQRPRWDRKGEFVTGLFS